MEGNDPLLSLAENQCVDVNLILDGFNDWTVRTDVRVVYSVIYTLIFVIGLIGNGLLISGMVMRKRYSVANIFLINLAISDLLLCITAVPITPVLAFMKRWMFGIFMCKLVPACQAISVLISTYCLCFIAVDRYRSIVTPLKEPWTIRHSQVLMIFTWLGALFVASPLYFTQTLQVLSMENIQFCGEFCGEYNWPEDDQIKIAYGIMLLILTFVIPAVIMSFCYMKILQKVRQDWIVAEGSMLTAAQQAQTSARKRRVMYVLMLMVVVFMASWLPLTALNLIRDLGWIQLIDQMYFKLLNVHAFAMSSIVWNPLLYFWMSKRHRRALKDDMTWLTNAKRQPTMSALGRFAPPPSVSFVYKRALEKHLISGNFRRGTLADPTCTGRERALQDIHANCFLLVPLMPLCQTVRRNSHLTIDANHRLILPSNGGGKRRYSNNSNTQTTQLAAYNSNNNINGREW